MTQPVGKRKTNSERVAHHLLIDQVIALRESNVPIRVIAKTVGKPEGFVSKVATRYYRKKAAVVEVLTGIRLEERRAQLEALDARVMRLVSFGPDPATLAAAGYDIREWLTAVEASRRIKAELLRIDGLGGDSYDRRNYSGVADATPPQTAKEYRSMAVQEFLVGLLDGQSEEFRAAVTRRIGEMIGDGIDAIGGTEEGPRRIGAGSGAAGDTEPSDDLPAGR